MSDTERYALQDATLSFVLPDGRVYELRMHGQIEVEVKALLKDFRTRFEAWFEPVLAVQETLVGFTTVITTRREKGSDVSLMHIRFLDPLPPPVSVTAPIESDRFVTTSWHSHKSLGLPLAMPAAASMAVHSVASAGQALPLVAS